MDAPLPLYANPKFPRRAEGVSRRRRVSRGNWFPLEGAYPAAQRQRFSAENRRAFRKEAEPFAKHSSRPADGSPVPGSGRLWAGALSSIEVLPTGKFHVDLKGLNAKRLESAGLDPDHIAVSADCTCCLPEKYWSHRYTHGERGSQAAMIAIV